MTGYDPSGYFATARERESIRRKRMAGEPPPWTTDRVFQDFRFCQVHREHDKTTEWFRMHIRDPLRNAPDIQQVKAALIFRWFNRIETIEIIKDLILGTWDRDIAQQRLEDTHPVVTGAYMIKTEEGMSKLEGVLYAIEKAIPKLEQMVEQGFKSIEHATTELATINGLGPFLAYEIASDLRWTPVLWHSPDILTWANAGPGCAHGLSRLFDVTDPWKWNRGKEAHQVEMVELMRELLELSRSPIYWPQEWDPWEMREVEHWACEYDKHCRGTAKERLKRRFRVPETVSV
jgi:hypothetical protein